jgi:hypothetical protein
MTLTIRASGLSRVMNCAGSVALAAQCPEPESSEAAREGTAAHEAAELVLTGQAPDLTSLIDRQMSNGVFVTAEMAEHLEPYVVMSQGWYIERKAQWQVCDGVVLSGATDAAAATTCDGTTLRIRDLKYGWSLVEAENNWQLVAYAILQGGLTPGVERIEMSIYQPRPWHPDGSLRTWTITGEKLREYAGRITSRLATLDDSLETGAHCKYCSALSRCPAAREMQFNAIDVAMNAGHTDPEDGVSLASQLDIIEQAQARLKLRFDSLTDAALARIKTGAAVPGYAAVPAYGNKSWKEGVTVDMVAAFTGRQDLSLPQLITPAQAKKRGVPDIMLDTLASTPQRGIKLARQDAKAASRAFKENK